MAYQHIRLEFAPEKVALLTLARPDSLNALHRFMIAELIEAVAETAASDSRCLLITGEGRGFSSGADLISGGGLPDDLGESLGRGLNPLIEAIAALAIPVVAAVNGPAAGAGCSLALAADIVIAARSAYFLQAFINIGLVPDAGSTWILPRLVGRARAMELMMLGERLPAEQALAWGLVSRMVTDEDLAAEAMRLAVRLAAGPTVALGTVRRLAREAEHLPLADALTAEAAAQRDTGRTQDFRNAAEAFARKEAPSFEGR
jgi:2-(1,2-epoxy-1,2-dihydrophenyl)acetyl-CoA isomerase